MNIAIDLRSLIGGQFSGVENYILNVVHGLLREDKQNQYTLYSNSFRGSNLNEFKFINSKIKLTRLPNKFVNLGLKTGLLNMEKLIGDFDVLFMPNPNQVNLKFQAKLVVTAHDLSPLVTPEFYDMKRRLWHKFLNLKKIFQRADVILAVSEYTKQDLIRLLNIPEHKIVVTYLGVDNKTFNNLPNETELRNIRNKYNLPGDYLLFLNTIEPRKNLPGVLKAFESYTGDEFLIIAGKLGWKYKEALKLINSSPKSSKIRYLGYIKDKDKPFVIKMAKALMYPSFYEGFGLQPLEAAASGVPSIISKVTALPEIMGSASLLVDPYNVSQITQAMSAICTDKQLRALLIEQGLETAKKYSWQNTVQKTLTAITKNY